MGISLGINTQSMVVDVDAFTRRDIPCPSDTWTWEDFERIALEIKQQAERLGRRLGPARLHARLEGGVPVARTSGSSAPTARRWATPTTHPWIDHWKMLLRLQAAGAIPTLVEEPMGSNVEALHMVTRKSAMEHVHSNQLVALWNAAQGEPNVRNFKMLPLPRVTGGDKSPVYMKPSQYFSITAASKYPKEAAKFIDFFTNDIEANKILGGERGVPVNTQGAGGAQADAHPAGGRVVRSHRARRRLRHRSCRPTTRRRGPPSSPRCSTRRWSRG